MSQCKIHFENYSGIYYPGSEIRGRLECYFDERTSLRGIKIRIKCKEYNQWTGTESYRDPSDDKMKTRFITLTGDRNVLYIEQMLYGSEHGSHELDRGRHVYPFSFTLPLDIPSSFKGPHGSISYQIKGIVDRPMRFDYEDVFIFVVQSPIDFNRMGGDLQTPSTYTDEKSVCCWCCAGGNITMEVELPKTAFTPGEVIPFKVAICNLSNSNVESLQGKLVKTITYRVTSPHSESKSDIEEILSFREHGVGAHGEHTFELELRIPSHIEVPNFAKCDLFHVSYNLEVSSSMPACTLDLDISVWDIQMGHIQCPESFIDEGPNTNHQSPPYAPPGEGYDPPPGFVAPPGFVGGFVPPGGSYPPPGGSYPPGYPGEKAPSAPSSSNASAPMAPFNGNAKAREAAEGPSAPAPSSPDLPPPSYSQVQHAANPPYPPQ